MRLRQLQPGSAYAVRGPLCRRFGEAYYPPERAEVLGIGLPYGHCRDGVKVRYRGGQQEIIRCRDVLAEWQQHRGRNDHQLDELRRGLSRCGAGGDLRLTRKGEQATLPTRDLARLLQLAEQGSRGTIWGAPRHPVPSR